MTLRLYECAEYSILHSVSVAHCRNFDYFAGLRCKSCSLDIDNTVIVRKSNAALSFFAYCTAHVKAPFNNYHVKAQRNNIRGSCSCFVLPYITKRIHYIIIYILRIVKSAVTFVTFKVTFLILKTQRNHSIINMSSEKTTLLNTAKTASLFAGKRSFSFILPLSVQLFHQAASGDLCYQDFLPQVYFRALK